jgi:hypothetical protein
VRGMLLAAATILSRLATPDQSFAQSNAVPPKFEVAAIRPCKPVAFPANRERGGASGNSPERLRIVCQTVERLIQWAYVSYANGEHRTQGFPLCQTSRSREARPG